MIWLQFSVSVPDLSGISNEAGRCQEGFSFCLTLLESLFFSFRHTHALAQERPAQSTGCSSSIFDPRSPYSLSPCHFITRCCPPSISSIMTNHDELMRTPRQSQGDG